MQTPLQQLIEQLEDNKEQLNNRIAKCTEVDNRAKEDYQLSIEIIDDNIFAANSLIEAEKQVIMDAYITGLKINQEEAGMGVLVDIQESKDYYNETFNQA